VLFSACVVFSFSSPLQVGLARTIYIRCLYGIFGREITKYTVIYSVYIRFWPTLLTSLQFLFPSYHFQPINSAPILISLPHKPSLFFLSCHFQHISSAPIIIPLPHKPSLFVSPSTSKPYIFILSTPFLAMQSKTSLRCCMHVVLNF